MEVEDLDPEYMEIQEDEENPEISVDENTTNTGSVSNTKRRKSKAWDHFTQIKKGKLIVKGKCRHCSVEIAAIPKVHGTSGLVKHLRRCPKFPRDEESSQSKLIFNPLGDGSATVSNWKFEQSKGRMALVEMVVIDELPLKFVEKEGFKKFCAVVCPQLHIPSRFTLARDVVGLFQSEKEKLKSLLNSTRQRICLTTDSWTSIQRINYMCVTAHYVDPNWTLQKRIINFVTISSHKGESISLAIEKCLREWDTNRVFTITVDNASSNDTAMGHFRKKMANWDSSILKGEFVHMRCVAHILNLVVSDGLKDISDSIMRVRNAIKYIRQSPARLEKFKEYAELEKVTCKKSLCLDVPTRWNSTYTMLDVVQYFERVFERFDEENSSFKTDLEYTKLVKKIGADGKVVYGPDGKAEKHLVTFDGRPTPEDWSVCRKYAGLLEHFYNLTMKISGSLYVTSNIFFHEIAKLHFLLKKWQDSDDEMLAAMGGRMKLKFDKYWGDPSKMNKMFFVAMVLDPRYKLDFLEFLLKEVYGNEVGWIITLSVKELMNSLFLDYKGKIQPQGGNIEKQPVQIPKKVDKPCVGQEAWEEVMSKYQKNKSTSGSVSEEGLLELEKYYREGCEVDKGEFLILEWWKQNSTEHRFPILSQIARDVLAIPISTVASESAFSTGGRVLDSFRSSLTPGMVQSLICSQDWLRSSQRLNNDEEELDDIENLENELLKMQVDVSSSTPMELK